MKNPVFEVLKHALKHKDKIIGVGLDSSEKGNPPKNLKDYLKRHLKKIF